MATTPNGIYLMENGDEFNHTTINLISSSVDLALEERDPQIIHTVANEADRAALAASFLPTPARPLYVHRTNAGTGRQLEVSINGTTWATITTERDTGWVTVPLQETTNFEIYTPGRDTVVRRCGNIVDLNGALRMITAGYIDGSGAAATVFTLPAEFRPANTYTYVMQGSGSNRWSMSVNPGGTCNISRYGPGSSTNNTWLPFNVNYIVD